MRRHLANATLLLTLAAVLTTPVAAATHTVNQSGISFGPDDLTVTVGDTVEWVWSGGSHTVTSGVDAADPAAGDLFDASLNSSNTTFSYLFDTVGDYPYFCRPHESIGMTGVVHVQPSVPNESATWGAMKSLFD